MQTTMARLLSILGLIYGLYSLNASGFFAALGVCRTDINARWALSGAVLSLLLLAILTPRFGLQGAAAANSGYLLTLIINIQVAPLLGTTARECASLLVRYAGMLSAFCVTLFLFMLLALPVWVEAIGVVTVGFLGTAAWCGILQRQLLASGPLSALRLLCVRAAKEWS
jgi:O-antigen/teichoic acid export membrane protein